MTSLGAMADAVLRQARAEGERIGGELLGYRRHDGAPIFRSPSRKVTEAFGVAGYEHRTWPSQATTADRWPTIRGWALAEEDDS